jgi:CHAT domain-containing protein/tetratricopeptide (TPR) repeat protein
MRIICVFYFISLPLFSFSQTNDTINDLIKKISVNEKQGDTISFDYLKRINDLGVYYNDNSNYENAKPLFIKSLKLSKTLFGKNNKDYIISAENLALLYLNEGNYKSAEPIYIEVLNLKKEMLGENNNEYITTLYDLSELYLNDLEFIEAEPYCIKALNLRKINLGIKNIDYLRSLNQLGRLYKNQGKFNDSEQILLDASNSIKNIFGENNIDYVNSIEILASLYQEKSKFNNAKDLYDKSIEIRKGKLDQKENEYVNLLLELATLNYELGKLSESEALTLKVIEIRKEILGENNPYYAISLAFLANIYEEEGKYEEVERLYIQSLNIIKNTWGENDEWYGIFSNNLALFYQNNGKILEAESLYLRSKIVIEENNYKYSEVYSKLLTNLASLYQDQNRYIEAEKLFKEALEISQLLYGKNSLNYIQILTNLASLYYKQSEYLKSEQYYLFSLKIGKKLIGKYHRKYINDLHDISFLNMENNKNKKAAFYFELFMKLNNVNIINSIYGISELDVISFQNKIRNEIESPLVFLGENQNQYGFLNKLCFENQLILKNISIKNHLLLKKNIFRKENLTLQIKYNQFIENKKEIRRTLEIPFNQQSTNIEKLKKETEKIEKELYKGSANFSEYKKSITVNSKLIKNELKKDEILVDFVSFNYYKKISTDSIVYAAFVLKKESKFPKFITFFEEKQLEFLLSKNKTKQDSTGIDKQYTEKDISDLFLKPLEKELRGITTIYLSPTGLGHQIDFAALPLSNKQLFGEKYKLHILSSPSEIMDYKQASLDKNNELELILYGGIDYDKTNTIIKSNNDIVDNETTFQGQQIRSGISEFGYLKGSKKEVVQIQLLGKQSGFKTTLLNDRDATELSIKKLDGRTTPFVLHLATHGFFFAYPIQELSNNIKSIEGNAKIYKASEDPMMRSGLVFAGANKYWNKTDDNTTIENGILTAIEISNLDLSACQLVVLSACETGLGEVKGSEGVFGLQRAFKMAGVKNIIMSLWKVPDTQTAELFDIFYSECFAGKTIHEAFQSAQSKMKAKYSPYYWAGFVLLE